jgi:hypothetical protein
MSQPFKFQNSGIKLISETITGVVLVLSNDDQMQLFVNEPVKGAPTFEAPVTGQGAVKKWDGKKATVAYSKDQTSGRTLTLPMQGSNGHAASGIRFATFSDVISLCETPTLVQYGIIYYDPADGLAPTETIDISNFTMGDGDTSGNFSITMEYEPRSPRDETL